MKMYTIEPYWFRSNHQSYLTAHNKLIDIQSLTNIEHCLELEVYN